MRLLAAYRRTGADLPFTDPRRPHDTAMEGWYWRLTDAVSGSVVVVLLGVARAPDVAPWALVGLAAHPGGVVHDVVVEHGVALDPHAVGIGAALHADEQRLRAHVGGAELDVTLRELRRWPRRAFGGLGAAQALPGLSQYWHPWLLRAHVDGHVRLAGRTLALDGARLYAEKNWGNGGFPQRWWWGQAHSFDRDDVTVAFAGGLTGLGGVRTSATSIVVALGDRVVRLVRRGGDEGWRLRARALDGTVVEVEGHADGHEPHLLPVPLPAERRVVDRAASQHLAGELRVSVRRRGRTLYEGVSPLAGLERGTGRHAPPPAAPPA